MVDITRNILHILQQSAIKGAKSALAGYVNVPIYLAETIEKNPNALLGYLEKDYPGVQIIRSKILMNQRIEYEGSELLLRSCRSEMYNARELFIPTYLHHTLWKLSERAHAKAVAAR